MSSDFEYILQLYGSEEKLLSALDGYRGRTAVTEILLARQQTATRTLDETSFEAMLQDSKYGDLLIAAVSSQSFEQVRQHIEDVMSASVPSQNSIQPSMQPGSSTGLALSFKQDYIGKAAEGLYNHLSRCNAEFRKAGARYNGRFCSIVQSSGTGKSRTIIQLMQTNVLGLYMNIRSKDEANSFPLRDDVPALILTGELNCSPEEYAGRCIALFTAIFTVIRQELTSKHEADVDPQVLIKTWSEGMCDMGSPQRHAFFKKVQQEYDLVLKVILPDRRALAEKQQLQNAGKPQPQRGNGSIQQPGNVCQLQALERGVGMLTVKDKVVDHLAVDEAHTAKMTPSLSQGSNVVDVPELPGEAALKQALNALVESFDFFDESHGPKLVIAIDEAHELSKMQGQYQPARILCRVISNFTQGPLSNWVLFASTTSKLADFSAPAPIRSSLRIRQVGEELFPPYSQFGWDQMAKPFSNMDPAKVAQFDNIVGFGRPLWSSLISNSPSADEILQTAGQMLCRNRAFNAQNSAHALAVWGQRCCLHISFGRSGSTEFQAEAVSSHLRVCSEIAENKMWLSTLYPSEPLLSCAASGLLHSERGVGGDQETNLALSLGCLSAAVETGMVEAGQKGELTCRIMYLSAKDLCVRSPSPKLWSTPHPSEPKWSEKELLDCRPLAVTDYLEFLFGETALCEATKELFCGWYINFSHWISMSQAIRFSGSKTRAKLSMETWLARHWCRTVAVQGYHGQRSFDQLIPMYKLGARPKQQSGDAAEQHAGCVSYLLILDRARQDVTESHLNIVTPAKARMPDLGQPYIVIHADLRAENKEPTFTLIQNQSSTHYLRIYAPGINSKTYSFLGTKQLSAAQGILKQMLDGPRAPLDRGPITQSLDAQLHYGDAPGDEHMEWEAGYD